MYLDPEKHSELRILLFDFVVDDAMHLCDETHSPIDEKVFTCTREKDHEGPHIACGSTEAIAIWTTKKDQNATSNETSD